MSQKDAEEFAEQAVPALVKEVTRYVNATLITVILLLSMLTAMNQKSTSSSTYPDTLWPLV